jgi:hypothetical protein
VTNTNKYNAYEEERCKNRLQELASNGIMEIALYGTSDVAGMLYQFTIHSPVRIKAIYDRCWGKKYFGFDVMPEESINNYYGKIVITTLFGVENDAEQLRGKGVKDEQIIVL